MAKCVACRPLSYDNSLLDIPVAEGPRLGLDANRPQFQRRRPTDVQFTTVWP